MIGPMPEGSWTSRVAPSTFMHLHAGARYRISEAFVDFDGDHHEVGESWFFLGHGFLPCEDGLSLFVSLDGRCEWRLPLQWRAETQGATIDRLEEIIRPL